jgi:hypothetical protein
LRRAYGRALAARHEDWSPAFRTVIDWLARDVADFRSKYERAREIQADVHADDITLIADTPEEGVIETDKRAADGAAYTEVKRADMIEHRKLRIAVRQWNAEKLRPKRYGQRQHIEHSGTIGLVDVTDDELVAQIIELVATGRLKLPNGVQLEERDDAAEDDFSDIA